jgi:hypothetical protein
MLPLDRNLDAHRQRFTTTITSLSHFLISLGQSFEDLLALDRDTLT